MGSVALYPASVLVWEDNRGVGLTYPIGPRVGWSGAAGGIEPEKANSGLNFIYLEYRYRLSALTIYLEKIASPPYGH